jgi:hypothetical protein
VVCDADAFRDPPTPGCFDLGYNIGRITTAGVITEFTIPTVNSDPYGIVIGSDGALWFAANGSNQIGRLAVTINSHDNNGDAYSDIAWRDTGGNIAIWLMNGNQLLQGGGTGSVPSTWNIVGQRDFNGDGKADLLWNDTSGNVAILFMNRVQVSQAANAPSAPGWNVVGTGDFNADGVGDILWEDASGDLAIWLMSGIQVAQAGGLGTLPSGWKAAGTGDFNADGKSDILFENTSGALGIWFMGPHMSSAMILAPD